MLRRLIALAVVVIGLAVLVGAVGSATLWRPDDRVSATLPSEPDQPAVVTAPGVLDAVDNTVQVRLIGATADSPVTLAMGREVDVHAWLEGTPYLEITGLTSWEDLEVREVEAAVEDDQATEDEDEGAEEEATEDEDDATAEEGAEEDEPPMPDPAGSDLWVEEVSGSGEVVYEWTAEPGRWVMLAAGDGTGPAPQVELTWDREVPTPLLVPGLILGGALLVGGAIALTLVLLTDRESVRARRARAERETEPGTESAPTPVLVPARREGRHRGEAPEAELSYAQRLGWPGIEPAETVEQETAADGAPAPGGTTPEEDPPLTRRELREREKARLAAERDSRRLRPFGRRGRRGRRGGSETAESDSAQVASSTAPLSGGADAPLTGAVREAPSWKDLARADAEHTEPGSGELSEWLRSGRSERAPDGSTSSGPGSVPKGPGGATPETTDERPARRRRLRRKRGRQRTPTVQPGPVAPDPVPSGDEQVVAADEESRLAGAQWRKTWGITTESVRTHDTGQENR